MTDDLDRYLSAPECAELAGVRPNTFTAYVNRGFAPAPVARIAGRRVWDRDEIRAWVKSRRARRAKQEKAAAAL